MAPTSLRGVCWLEAGTYGEVALTQRLRDALVGINLDVPEEALVDAFRKLTRPESADLIQRSRAVNRLLVNGERGEYPTAGGGIGGAQVQEMNFDGARSNDWRAVNRFAAVENKHEGRTCVMPVANRLSLA